MLQIDDDGNSYDDGVYEADDKLAYFPEEYFPEETYSTIDFYEHTNDFGSGNAGIGIDLPGIDDPTGGSSTYETGITPPAGVYPNPDSPTGYSDAQGNPIKYDSASKIFTSSSGVNLGVGSNTFSGQSLGFLDSINKALGTKLTASDLTKMGIGAGALAGLAGLNKPNITKVGYQGGIPQLQANRIMMTAPPATVDGKPYRPGQGGVNYGGDVTYSPRGTPAASVGGSYAPSENKPQLIGGEMSNLIRDADAPKGVMRYGIANLAAKPADTTISQATDYGSENFARGGSTGSYLQGSTDGMADKLRTSIDGKQPAALSHGEFVIPADVVSHLGNGNSDAGAKKLYSMMDKIRKARTGSKKQGKQINPDKFMPGGLAQAYAQGGGVRGFAAGDVVPVGTTGVEQGLSSYVGPYVTDMLGKGQALANAPYQQYTGQLTAGPSSLQNQAFGAAANLQTPSAIGQAANTAGGIASAAQNMGYNPMQATSQYQAPGAYQAAGTPQYNQLNAGSVASSFQAPAAYQTGNFSNQFTAPTQSAATNFTNQYQAPTPYQNTNFSSGTFGNEQAQQYMNPYLQQSLNPQLTEARRQSDITAAQNNAAMTKAGAFGGGRQAILTAENQRNLGTNLANITGQGYNTAFTNAMSQYNADQGRNLQAQQAAEASKQFGANQSMTAAQLQAQYGMSAQQAQEAARQFNQQQAMTGAQSAAQYGLAGQQATEASRQFGANQGLQAATTAGSQGLQAALANQQAGLTSGQGNINAALEAARQQEQSRQFGAGQSMTSAQNAAQYGQAAQQANIGQQQFGANYGLQGLNAALQAAQAQGQLGASQNQTNLANLNAQAGLGATQAGITQAGLTADKAAFTEARDNPYKMLQFQQSLLNGLPISATNYTQADPSALTSAAAGATTVDTLLNTLGLGSGASVAAAKK